MIRIFFIFVLMFSYEACCSEMNFNMRVFEVKHFLRSNNISEARRKVDDLVIDYPNEPDSHIYCGIAYAFTHFRFNTLGNNYSTGANLEKGITCLKKGMELEPDSAMLWGAALVILNDTKDYKGVMKYFSEYWKVFNLPSGKTSNGDYSYSWGVILLIGESYIKVKNTDQLLKYYDELIEFGIEDEDLMVRYEHLKGLTER